MQRIPKLHDKNGVGFKPKPDFGRYHSLCFSPLKMNEWKHEWMNEITSEWMSKCIKIMHYAGAAACLLESENLTREKYTH